jgi:hypothetical protein
MIFFVTPAGASFLIDNGDFESGLNGWQSSYNVSAKGSWADVDPFGGSRQAVMSDMGFFPANLSQDFSVDAGTSISISFDYNLWAFNWFCGKKGDDFVVSLAGGTYFDEVLRENIADGRRHKATISDWQHFEKTFDFEKDMDLSIMFELDNFKSPLQLAMAFVDNVKIESCNTIATPVPPALLLLMSGVAGLFTAKKKLYKYSG